MTDAAFDPFAGGEILRVSPTTWPQKEVIASAQMSDEANTAFNEAVSITINGEINIELLEVCFNNLVARHDILRATFSRKGDEICLHKAEPFRLRYADLRDLTPEAQQREIADLWRNIAISPMNLEEGPLFFVWIKRLGDTRFELIIAAHHIVCDGWTFGLLLNELASMYRSQGDDGSLSPAASFFDFAEMMDAGEIANAYIDYWREKFKKVPPVLDLPIDKARPHARPFQAKRFDFELNGKVVGALPGAASKMKASVVNVVLAGYFALLYRLTSTEDLVVGLPVAGQNALKRLNQAGHMVHLLPVRLSVNGETTFRELVGKIKNEVLNATEHPNFTFGKLMENMVVDRSRVPLIPTIFNIDQPMNSLDFGNASAALRTVPRAAENFEIFLNIMPAPGRLTIEATYSTALFSEATIEAWLQSLENILLAASENPEKKLSDFALISAIPDVLIKSNETATNIQYSDFIRAFRAQVEKTPDAEAVIFSGQKLDYSQLDQLSDAFAVHLAEKGVGDGSVVGVCCERSERMIVSILAVLKLGAAYLPLDPDFPEGRLLDMLQDSGAAFIVEDAAAPNALRDAPVVHFDNTRLVDMPTTARPIALPLEDPDRMAYIIYTSGSTGKPKGVRVQNRAMINFLEAMSREPGCSECDRLLAVTTLSFDISVLELYLPLICGASTVIASREQARDGNRLSELINKHNISILQATPSTWRMLMTSNWRDQNADAGKLKALCGGESLPPDLAAELVDRVAELWNMFGPTETTVWSACKRIKRQNSLITIGKPISNTSLYILDQQMNPLPVSAPGELFIGGDGVALGYHNRGELNDARFIDHPGFGRVYRTGDLARLLPNGEIMHMGRMDDQVKLRGYRIELGEIESALLLCQEVKAAAVYLWELSPEDVRIVACCVPASPGSFQSVLVRKHLRGLLPGYMIPQYLMIVDEIPLLPNGKINRRALPRPEVGESNILTSSSLTSDTEKMVARIWSELIKPKNPIGREDNFFELGGHSLLALEAIRKIENTTGKRLTIGELVSERLASLAGKISASVQEDDERAGPVALSGAAARRLAPEQERILERQLEYPGSVCNNLPAAWIIDGDLDVSIFGKSLERVYERQTALRTVIQAHDRGYRQVLLHVSEIELPAYADLANSEAPMDDALERANQLAMQPFSPLNSLLCRNGLFKIDNKRHLFVFVPHQLVFDGWSFDIFLGELDSFYRAFSEGRPPQANPLSFEYRDYTEWYRFRDINPETLDYHLASIDGRSAPEILQNVQTKGICARRVFDFPEPCFRQIEIFCDTGKIRLHEFLFAGFATSLRDVIGQSEFIVGIPVTGRYDPDVIGLVGSFVSVLPCTVQVNGTGFSGIAKSIAGQLREFHEHQDISYAEIINRTPGEKEWFPSYVPAMFGFQDIRNRPTDLAGMPLTQIDIPRAQTELPIEFWVRIQSDGFKAVFDYDSAMVTAETIEAIGAVIAELFKNVGKMDPREDVQSKPADFMPMEEKKSLWRRLFR